jgi:SnoaL-like domain
MKSKIILPILILIAFPAKAQTMTDSLKQLNTNEAAYRIAIRELIDNYGYYADRREAQKQAALYTENAIMEIYRGEPDTSKPVAILKGRKELEEAFSGLKSYNLTFHLNGQNTIKFFGDSATGTAYCLAHHIFVENGKRMLLIMGIHYYDTYSHRNNQWLFAQRKLIIDWEDKRTSTP